MYQTFSRNETGSYRTHVVDFRNTISLAQIRIPRSNSSVHILLPKLETYFLENNFILEVFALEEHSDSFVLLFSEKINTEKIIQDLIIPVEPPRRVTRVVFRGNFGNIPVVLYALSKAGGSEPQQTLIHAQSEKNNLKNDSFRSYYSKLNPFFQITDSGKKDSSTFRMIPPAPVEWLRPHYLEINYSSDEKLQILNNILTSRMGNVINFSNITPNLLFSKVSDEIKDDENSQLLLMKLEDEVNGLQTFFASPNLLKNEQNILLYIDAMNDSCIMIYQFMEKNRSFENHPYFFEDNLGKNNDLSPLLTDFVEQAIYGQVDFENEVTSAMALLSMILNSPKHVEKLIKPEFIKQFFKIGFGSGSHGLRLMNLFHECFNWLCYNKKFRNYVIDPSVKSIVKDDINFHLKLDMKRRDDSEELTKRNKPDYGMSESDSEDDYRKHAKDDKKAKKSKKEKELRDVSKESKKKKDKKKKHEKSKKDTRDEDKDKDKDKRKSDGRRRSSERPKTKEKKKRDKSEDSSSIKRKEKKKKKSSKNHHKNSAVAGDSNIDNIYQRNLKALLESQTRFFFNKHRCEHFVLSLGQYLKQYSSIIKNMVTLNLVGGSLLLHFERSFFILKKIWKLIRNLVEEPKDEPQINAKIVDQLKNSVREVLQGSSDIHEILTKTSKKRSHIITNALANFLTEENFFELIILHLSNANFKSSDFYEMTLSTSCRMLLYILTCNGGVCLILKNKPFVRDLLKFLKIEMDKVPEIQQDLDESMLNSLHIYDSSVFDKYLYISPKLTLRCFSNPKEGKEARISSLAAQYLYLFENIVSAVGIMDNLYCSLLSLGSEHDILLHLIQIAQMFENTLLSAQAISLVLKEEYFFETLLLILKVDSVELYEKVRHEISIVCKILFLFLFKSTSDIAFTKCGLLREALKGLDKIIAAYCLIKPEHLREKSYIELDSYLISLKTLIEPFEKLKEDYNSFISGMQACSRYTHTNINTLLSNKQHFLNVEREFPKTDKKKYFGRLNDYLSFFKTCSSKNNQILTSISYLKTIKYCLDSNKSAFLHFVNSNIFDITNFLVLVAEMVVSCFVNLGNLSRQIQFTYLEKSTDIIRDYVTLFDLGLKILKEKAEFKEQLEGHGKEYENVDLFLAVINFIVTVKDIKPNYFYELCIKNVFELEEYYNAPLSPIKSPYKKHKYMIKFKSFCYSKEFAQSTMYMDSETKSMIIEIINTSVEMFSIWGKFPGSYDVLLTELIFLIFTKNVNREVYFILLAVFINEPRKSPHKEKIRKIIHTLLFEKVRTLKKSKLILIQKYGSIRSDSLFDIFVTQNGYSTTIEYFIHSYLTIANKSLFFSFGFFLMTLIEWKDVGFSSLIASTFVTIYNSNHDNFIDFYRRAEFIMQKHAQNSHNFEEEHLMNPDFIEDCIQTLKTLGKVIEMMNLLSLTGIFKIYMIEANITKNLFEFLSLKINKTIFSEMPVYRYYILVKLEVIKLLNVLMDEDIGFAYKEKDILTEDKFFSEVISEENIKALIKILNRELQTPVLIDHPRELLDEPNSNQEIEEEIFNNNLEILKKLARNPVGKNICSYGNYSKLVKKYKKPSLKLKRLTKFLFKFLDENQFNSNNSNLEGMSLHNQIVGQDHNENSQTPNGHNLNSQETNINNVQNDNAVEKQVPILINAAIARKLTNLVDAYLQTAFMLVTHTLEDCFLFTESRLQALTKILSEKRGFEVWLTKMQAIVDMLKSYNLEQDLLSRSELCLYCLTTYKQQFENEKRGFERHVDIPEQVDIKIRLQKYNKSYFRFEPTLDELSRRRNFLVNLFQYLESVLENKFMRSSKHKNFCKISFTKKIEYFFDIRCMLIRFA